MIITPANRRPFFGLHEAKVRGHAKRGFQKRLGENKIKSNLNKSEIRLASTRAIQRAMDKGTRMPPERRKAVRRLLDAAESEDAGLWRELKELFPRERDYYVVRGLYLHFLRRIRQARKGA